MAALSGRRRSRETAATNISGAAICSLRRSWKKPRRRDVYLPAGDWFDWWTGEKTSGGRTVAQVDLKTMPIYVCAGAIIPSIRCGNMWTSP